MPPIAPFLVGSCKSGGSSGDCSQLHVRLATDSLPISRRDGRCVGERVTPRATPTASPLGRRRPFGSFGGPRGGGRSLAPFVFSQSGRSANLIWLAISTVIVSIAAGFTASAASQ